MSRTVADPDKYLHRRDAAQALRSLAAELENVSAEVYGYDDLFKISVSMNRRTVEEIQRSREHQLWKSELGAALKIILHSTSIGHGHSRHQIYSVEVQGRKDLGQQFGSVQHAAVSYAMTVSHELVMPLLFEAIGELYDPRTKKRTKYRAST
jgi:hypothetical protein